MRRAPPQVLCVFHVGIYHDAVGKPDEEAFESHIADWLHRQGGYLEPKVGNQQGQPHDFDATLGIDTAELFAFIGATQADEWANVLKSHSGDPGAAQQAFTKRLSAELDARGTVDVLRRGVVYAGSHKADIKLAYFKPAFGLNEKLAARYAANRLTVTRQLPFDPNSTKTLDLCLFVNGLPVATAELKNHLTRQTMADAQKQYGERDAKNLTLANRAVVHFAADTESVSMTTKLAGKQTRFLHFNKGNGQAAGNPVNKNGHRTAYLWEDVWKREPWLDLLRRFVHVEKDGKGSKAKITTIFPRFHQWDAVLRIEDDARTFGAGHSYLIQHSAGSGKSNTIAWLAYRLSTLHADDKRVFNKVIVITDRVVLDRQLQETIYRIDHTQGVVQKIDEDSSQLAASLAGDSAQIIITTLQKFPHVMKHGEDLPDRRYAVIIDEAHSSQTGESAKEMKRVLGVGPGAPEAQLAAAEEFDFSATEEAPDPVEDMLAAEVAARGRQANMSFFAFTATPKAKTLELFGTKNDQGKPEAFHLYSMRQAIEEGYIHDTLANYLTYQTYYKLEKAIEDDPAYATAKARVAIAKYVSLHEHNLAQRAEIIVKHFQEHVRHKVGGQAKAMVVTSSRLHALRYKQQLDKYCNEHGIKLGVLVAFSGSLNEDGDDITESKANGFPDTQTPERFDTDEFQIMVVAEKYQTGFDQPKLYAMYVDKTLSGLAAVQTLSRLNRTHPKKDGTFVLDLRNDAEDIKKAFAPWYTRTVAQPTEPHLMYTAREELNDYGILWPEEIHAFVTLLLLKDNTTAGIHAALGPAVERFNHDLDDDEKDGFRDALTRFVRTYSFLSQIVSFGDVKLERDYLFCKALAQFVRDDAGNGIDLAGEIELTHLTITPTFEGSVGLDPDDDGELTQVTDGGGGRKEEEAPLSEIINKLNDKHGLNLPPEARLVFDTAADKMVDSATIQQAAAANDGPGFKLAVQQEFKERVIEQFSVAQDVTSSYLDNEELADDVLSAYLPLIQTKAIVAGQQHCPIGQLLDKGEGAYLEYKSTLRTHAQGDDLGQLFKPLETASIKTIAAFLNSEDGGTLLIGAQEPPGTNKGVPFGLQSDYVTLHKDGKDDADLFQLHLTQIVQNSMGSTAASRVITQMHSVDGKDICRVHVKPSAVPVQAKVVVVKKGQHEKKTAFYIRLNGKTHEETDEAEKQKYIATRWPSN